MLTRLCICVPSFLLNKQKTQNKYKSLGSLLSNHTNRTVRSTFDPSMLCLDRCCLLESQFFCCFAVFCSTMGRPRIYATESARKRESTKSRRKVETAAARRRVFGKSYILVKSNDTTGITSDMDFAKYLLDRLVTCYYSASTIFALF